MSAPSVSVITIFYNAAPFLAEAVASVLAQTYGDWELLLVDDGSTDGSTEIARAFAEAHPVRVRYLVHPGRANRGMSASRNLGLARARGEFVAFLDADDVFLPHKLEEQVALMDAHPEVGMLYGRTLVWHGWTGKPGDAQRDRLTPAAPVLDHVTAPPEMLLHYLRREAYHPCMCSILVRREVAEAVGGFEEVFRGTYEDMAFHAKVFLRAPVLVSSACWDLYRQHDASSWAEAVRTGQYIPRGRSPAKRRLLDWLQEYVARTGTADAEVQHLLTRRAWPYRHPLLHAVTSILRRAARLVSRWRTGKGCYTEEDPDATTRSEVLPDLEAALGRVRRHTELPPRQPAARGTG